MEIKIKKHVLYKAFSEVSKSIPLNASLSMLVGIKITADKNGLTLVGSYSEMVVEKCIPTVIDGEKVMEVINTGSVVVTANYLSEAVKKLLLDIHITVNENFQVTIESGEIVIHLNGCDPLEYPVFPQIDHSNSIRVPGSKLIDCLKQTLFATAKTDTRPILTAVNMTFEQTKLSCTATNSQRLAYSEFPIEYNGNGSFNVPSKTLKELLRLMDNDAGTITIFATDHYIAFKSKTISLFSKLIEGKYPQTSALIPKESKTSFILDRKQFLQGIDRTLLFAEDKTVHLEVKNGTDIRISSSSGKIGKIEETQLIQLLSGEKELQASMNGAFLIDAFKAFNEEKVKVSFNGKMRPVSIEAIDANASFQMISPVLSN